jgi:hypothetical protein
MEGSFKPISLSKAGGLFTDVIQPELEQVDFRTVSFDSKEIVRRFRAES